MLAPKSTHKRKRSSARSDKARKLGPSRWIVNNLPSNTTSSDVDTASSADKAVSSGSHVGGLAQNKRLVGLIDSHPFNRSLEVLLPFVGSDGDDVPSTSATLPASVQSLSDRIDELASTHRSYKACIPLSMLLDPIFVTAYLKTGSLIALSDESGAPGLSPDLEDSACIDGQGTLLLSLCKDTYQTLGLTGRASHFSRLASGRAADRTSGPNSRFIVELPLLSPSFTPGKKGYQQALDRLRAWDRSRAEALATEHTIAHSHASSKMSSSSTQPSLPVTSEHATWNMLFVWSPDRANAEALSASGSSSSLVNEIRFPDHLVRLEDVEVHTLQASRPAVTDSVWVPPLSYPEKHPLGGKWRDNERHFSELEPSAESTRVTWPEYQEALQEVVEWAGLVSLGADPIRTFTRADATCVYAPPSTSTPGKIAKLSWSGSAEKPLLLSPLLISQIASEVERFIAGLNDASSRSRSMEARWATLSCSGFPHAPLTWRSKVPFSAVYGAKELPSNKSAPSKQSQNSVNEEQRSMDSTHTDVSSSDNDDNDDSDSSLDMGEHRPSKRKTNKRSKRNLGRNQTEHTFRPSSGETGWISFCLGPTQPTPAGQRDAPPTESSQWVFVELIGTDTRS